MNNILIQDLAHRLPYRVKGILQDELDIEAELVGIDLSKPELPLISVSVPGSKAAWTCNPDFFKPLLYPISKIYSEINGVVPWIEFEKRWELDGLDRIGASPDKIPEILDYKFIPDKGKHAKWMLYELTRQEKSGKTYTHSGTATFYHHIAYQIAYEMGIDVSGLIDLGLAISRE